MKYAISILTVFSLISLNTNIPAFYIAHAEDAVISSSTTDTPVTTATTTASDMTASDTSTVTADQSLTANFEADTVSASVCNLEIEKTVDKQSASPGDALVFTITFRNTGNGNCTGSGVKVEDVLDPSLTYISESHSGNVWAGYDPEPVYDSAKRTVFWNADVLSPGESGSVTLNVEVKATSCAYVVENQAKITSIEYSNFTRYVSSNITSTSIRNEASCVPVTPAVTHTVTIDKFIDGEMATAESANSAAFPMHSSWSGASVGQGSGSYELKATGSDNNPHNQPYEAITLPLENYATNENTSGPIVGTDCKTGDHLFALVGYSTGTTLAVAKSAVVSTTSPNFTDLTSDEHVIVWNRICNANSENHPPVITLIGDATTTITVGNTFIDPGATATDTEDGNLTSSIIVTGGPVATSTVGTTTLIYTVTDSGGLSASTTRIVIVNATTTDGGTSTGQAPGVLTIGPKDNISTTTDSTNPTISVDYTLPIVTTTATTTLDSIATTSIDCLPSSGSLFTVGTTTEIICTANDSAGNTATSTFSVTVSTTTPSTDVPPQAIVSSGGGGSSSSSSGSFYGGGFSSGGFSSGGFSSGGGTPLLALASVKAVTNTPIACPLLNSYLRYGYNNDPTEVVKLQAFLQRIEGYDVGINGTFDQKTLSGVNAFQTKYLSDVMGPWGASQSSGYVYITTKKKVNQIACDVAFIINPAEQSIIDTYKAAQVPVPTPAGQNGPTINPSSGINPNNSTTSPDIGLENNNSSNNSNTASVINASILGRSWSFITGLFSR